MKFIENFGSFVSQEVLPPIIFLCGKENFLAEEAYKSIVNKLSKNTDYEINLLDGEKTDVKSLTDIAESYSFFTGKRLIAIRNFNKLFSGKLSKNIEKSQFARLIENPQETNVILIWADHDSLDGISEGFVNSKKKSASDKKISSLKFPYNKIINNHHWIEFAKVDEFKIKKIIQDRFKSNNKTIEEEALELLVTNTSDDIRELSNEVDKICLYHSNKQLINSNDIVEISSFSKDYNVFELQKAVGLRNKKKSYEILENMLATSSQEVFIVSMLFRYFNIIWKFSELRPKYTNDYDLSRELGVYYKFIPEYATAFKLYGLKKIEKILIKIAETDEQLKSSSASGKIIMQTLFLEIF